MDELIFFGPPIIAGTGRAVAELITENGKEISYSQALLDAAIITVIGLAVFFVFVYITTKYSPNISLDRQEQEWLNLRKNPPADVEIEKNNPTFNFPAYRFSQANADPSDPSSAKLETGNDSEIN